MVDQKAQPNVIAKAEPLRVANTADDSSTESETEPESEPDRKPTPAAPVVDQKAHDEFPNTNAQAANDMAEDSVTESESEPEHESNHAHRTVCLIFLPFLHHDILSLSIGCIYSAAFEINC